MIFHHPAEDGMSKYVPGVQRETVPSSANHFDVSIPLFISVASGTSLIALAVAAYCSYRCWRGKRGAPRDAAAARSLPPKRVTSILQQPNVKISQSVPDLAEDKQQITNKEEKIGQSKYYKTVIKQTTLPTVSQRHLPFQRQLSHQLNLSNVDFTIQSVKYKEQPAVGLLKPELYRQNAQETPPTELTKTAGKLYFSVKYITEIESLVVTILQAENLPPKDFSGTSDPYVKLYLLPDRKQKFQTKVHRRTLNPEFNEQFAFSAPLRDLHERVLQFSVYDFDRFSRHDLIGVVMLRELGRHHELGTDTHFGMDVISVSQEKVDLGELMLSLCYLPTAGRLTVTIIKARNLKAMDITGTSDPYVKVSLMCRGKRIKKKKTSVKKSTLNPVYNEAIVFDVPQENVEEVSLLIKVVDYDRMGSNELMGCVALGPRYVGAGRDHWFEMLENPRKPVAQWYPLLEHVPGLSPSSADPGDPGAAAATVAADTAHDHQHRAKRKARK